MSVEEEQLNASYTDGKQSQDRTKVDGTTR
jgi:hypothetical protein